MPVSSATAFYPANLASVDSGGAVDIKALETSVSDAGDTSQTVQATHTQDNAFRTFDPQNAGVVLDANPGTLQRLGWAVRLTSMTPTDDTNCNAVLTAGTITISLRVTINQSGGTYTGGTYTPNWRVTFYSYNPATNAGALLLGGVSDGSVTWNYTPATGDLGTFKTVTFTAVLASKAEFAPGEVLLAQIGLRTDTIPNPTVGTATWTYTLDVQRNATNITFESGQGLRELCETQGASSGIGSASGVPVIVLPALGSSDGVSTVTGLLQAQKETTGSASGVATTTAELQAEKETTGEAAGVATVSGASVIIVPTTGEAVVGASAGSGGSTIYIFDD